MPESVNGQPGLEWQIQRFYAGKATEVGGSCTGPLIRSVTAAETIEESEDQVVMRVRYYWIDQGMVTDDRVFPYNSALSCRGFAERNFTFAKMEDGTLQVIDMNGAAAQRAAELQHRLTQWRAGVTRRRRSALLEGALLHGRQRVGEVGENRPLADAQLDVDHHARQDRQRVSRTHVILDRGHLDGEARQLARRLAGDARRR